MSSPSEFLLLVFVEFDRVSAFNVAVRVAQSLRRTWIGSSEFSRPDSRRVLAVLYFAISGARSPRLRGDVLFFLRTVSFAVLLT